LGNGGPELVAHTGGSFSEQRLELCERVFDWIEVRALRREEAHAGSDRFDCRPRANDV